MQHPETLFFAALALSATPALAAPNGSTPNSEPIHALNIDDGHSVLAGSNWRARLTREGVTFTPALGRAAERNRDLVFETRSVEVGGRSLGELDCEVAPMGRGNHVAFDRGAGITERWTPSAEGIELSYLFATLPEERGEIVVRLGLQSDLPLEHQTLDGARFADAALGGVEIGAVTGIDATGWEGRGDLRIVGETLELVLPAEFVEHAALPLVLDPFIGPALNVTADPFFDFNEGRSDVAYDAASGRYLIAYEIILSATDTDVYAELVDENGAPEVQYIALESSSAVGERPAVAGSATQGDFLVVWQLEDSVTGWDIHGIQVDPSDGSLTPSNLLASGPMDQKYPLLGGDAGTSPYALLIYQEEDTALRSSRVHYSAGGPWIATTAHVTGLQLPEPNTALTRSAGEGGRHMVVWENVATGTGGTSRIVSGALLSDDGVLLHYDPFLGPTSFAGQEHGPAVCGDGTDFVITYLRDQEQWGDPQDGDEVRAWRLAWDGSDLVLGIQFHLVSTPLFEATALSCALVGDQVLVAMRESGPFGSSTRALALDRETLERCEDVGPLSGQWPSESGIRIASQRSSGSPDDDRALIVWRNYASDPLFGGITDSDIAAQVFRSATTGAASVDLGGGTPQGGRAYAPCAFVGSSNFALAVRDTAPLIWAVGLAGTDPFDLPCGGGALKIDPSTALLFPATLTGSSSALTTVGIPDNPVYLGQEFDLQFISFSLGTQDCDLFDVNFSNAIRFTIE